MTIVFRDKLLVLIVDSVAFSGFLPQADDFVSQLGELGLLVADDLPLSLIVRDDLVELFESEFDHGETLLGLLSQGALLEELLLGLEAEGGLSLDDVFTLV